MMHDDGTPDCEHQMFSTERYSKISEPIAPNYADGVDDSYFV